uniref:cytochrome P450 2D26-like n=1 Tax=Styela clava TaxID=7725 RepID=UPI00193975E3|nr:cytochrome P450 2D26-like [Styela clava]
MLSLITTAIVGLLLGFIYKFFTRDGRSFPPGPFGIPILGSLYLLGEYPEKSTMKLAKKYGNVFSLRIFNKRYVCLIGTKANREISLNNNVADRKGNYVVNMAKGNDDPPGVIHSRYSSQERADRQFLHTMFTDVNALPDNNFKKIAQRETTKLVEKFTAMFEGAGAHYVRDEIRMSVFTTMSSLVFGSRNQRSDEEIAKMEQIMAAFISLEYFFRDNKILFPEYLPWLSKIWLPKAAKMFLATCKGIFIYIEDGIENHKKTFDAENDPRDMVDCYLKLIAQGSTKKDIVHNDHNMKILIFDTFLGSIKTCSTTIEWALVYLAAHQDVQARLYEEIKLILGSNGNVTYRDIMKMPYAKATLYEVSRFCYLLPQAIPRVSSNDITFNGYFIPKGTTFLMNLYSCNTQEDKWKYPDEFNPDNFLGEDGEFKDNDAFMAFGIGSRKCAGPDAGNQQVFMIMIKVVQKFIIKPKTDNTKIDYKGLPGFVRMPAKQKLRLELRT